jgi:hypothetical protein
MDRPARHPHSISGNQLPAHLSLSVEVNKLTFSSDRGYDAIRARVGVESIIFRSLGREPNQQPGMGRELLQDDSLHVALVGLPFKLPEIRIERRN